MKIITSQNNPQEPITPQIPQNPYSDDPAYQLSYTRGMLKSILRYCDWIQEKMIDYARTKNYNMVDMTAKHDINHIKNLINSIQKQIGENDVDETNS